MLRAALSPGAMPSSTRPTRFISRPNCLRPAAGQCINAYAAVPSRHAPRGRYPALNQHALQEPDTAILLPRRSRSSEV